MKPQTRAFVALSGLGLMFCASCSSEPKPEPTAKPPVVQSTMTTRPGEAGRVEEDVFRAQAIVDAVDLSSRKVTLKGPEGREHTFTAGPEIQNLAQLKVGDRVSATFARRLVVIVRRDEAPPSESYDSVSATARVGDNPGMLVAEETKVVARVKSINTEARTASLEFPDSTFRTVAVRPDVDLSKYKVGDNVVIRATTSLTVLTEATGR